MNHELKLVQSTFTYNHSQMDIQRPNQPQDFQPILENPMITNTRIIQTIKFRYAQYMGNHHKDILWLNLYTTPNCTLCPK